MANAITLSRLPLLVAVVLMLVLGSPGVQVATALVVLLLILMDSLDGIVARRRHEEGMLGSKLDIAVDRVVELVLWVTYAQLGVISLAIPIIYIIRGTLVDTVRSFSLVWGETSFGMMQTKWGRRLVAGGFMRTLYGGVKLLAFCTLALGLGLGNAWSGTPRAAQAGTVRGLAIALSWTATGVCLIRGAPVLVEARHLLRDLETKVTGQTTARS
jgi:CDP-diacylglycerol--glycerol-3-phosphate 3-phosphatidyltransferase